MVAGLAAKSRETADFLAAGHARRVSDAWGAAPSDAGPQAAWEATAAHFLMKSFH